MFNSKTVNNVFLVLFVLTCYAIFQLNWPIYLFLVVGGIWFLLTLIGSTNIQLNYFFKALHKNPNVVQQRIALTFDDGPHPNTLKVLELLKKYDAKATFFCIGHQIDEHPTIFKKIIAEGHTVANHTYAHPKNYGFLSTKTLIRELETCNQAAENHSGLKLKLFRSPFGVTNPKIKKTLIETGHVPIGWSVRSFDALFNSEELIFNKITKNLKAGDVILMHDAKMHTLAVLERLLLFLQDRKIKSVTVDELFQISPYR